MLNYYCPSNENLSWIESRGFYLFYTIFLVTYHLILLSLPFTFFTTQMVWTITNISHNLIHLYFLHIIKGVPWISRMDDGNKKETHWEQLDGGVQWTRQRKILTAIPIILFLLTCLYTQNSESHFMANFISLIVVTLPKLPMFHHVRLFNINKY
ncbi:CLUMA_CG021236, isoform A [Clunio marinus]|uniref:CLUMA_CG021236, isoform A n=1 Tax=Clunio marinus TaxID=568069 RepID=A0A1J1J912_9DIPT|nr:CLUMA_CG021236, isoform A [Clunio marinus]